MISCSEGKIDQLLAIEEFEQELLMAETEFQDEVIRRMALLKVWDDEIFNQVMWEVEVDSEQSKSDINHQIKQAVKIQKACSDEETWLWNFVNKSVFIIYWKRVLWNIFTVFKNYVAEKKLRWTKYADFANKFY